LIFWLIGLTDTVVIVQIDSLTKELRGQWIIDLNLRRQRDQQLEFEIWRLRTKRPQHSCTHAHNTSTASWFQTLTVKTNLASLSVLSNEPEWRRRVAHVEHCYPAQCHRFLPHVCFDIYTSNTRKNCFAFRHSVHTREEDARAALSLCARRAMCIHTYAALCKMFEFYEYYPHEQKSLSAEELIGQPVSVLKGISERLAKALRGVGVVTVGDLAQWHVCAVACRLPGIDSRVAVDEMNHVDVDAAVEAGLLSSVSADGESHPLRRLHNALTPDLVECLSRARPPVTTLEQLTQWPAFVGAVLTRRAATSELDDDNNAAAEQPAEQDEDDDNADQQRDIIPLATVASSTRSRAVRPRCEIAVLFARVLTNARAVAKRRSERICHCRVHQITQIC
jgi:hypothetical protein